ncbi:hypothetical protein NL676_002662 [Syzygium grande]|nr:hypothetical protein NL676_002662 [Syzygium grande]
MADTLPIGYRFSPSDEQLFFYYLAHRVRGDLSFSGFIPEFDVYEKEPWKFFDEDADRSLYVFTKIKMKKSRAERTAGSGFWKGVKTTDIEDHQGNIVGHKKHFNFKAKDGSSFERENAAKGSWIMHEYSMLKQEIVLCKIRFKKEESGKKQGTTIFLSMAVRTREDHRLNESSDFNHNIDVPHQDINMESSETMSLFSHPLVDRQAWYCTGLEGEFSTLASQPCLAISAQPVFDNGGFVSERRPIEQSFMGIATSGGNATSPALPITEENTDDNGSQWFLDHINLDWTNGWEDPEDIFVPGEWPLACDVTASEFAPLMVEALE